MFVPVDDRVAKPKIQKNPCFFQIKFGMPLSDGGAAEEAILPVQPFSSCFVPRKKKSITDHSEKKSILTPYDANFLPRL